MRTASSPIATISLNDGTVIPQLGYGTLSVQPDREATAANIGITARVVSQALEAGYRHIDTAQAYGTEAGVGKAIAESGIPRDELYITSKLSNDNHRTHDVRASYERTRDSLGIEQLDLFLVHWPLPTVEGIDYVETWTAMVALVAAGELRTAGVSNFQPAHLDRLIADTGVVPAVNQVELHPLFTNDAVRATCGQHGIAVEAHSPLGHNGKPLRAEQIGAIAAAHERTAAQILLRWHLQHGTIAIPKSAQPSRMAENLAVFDFELTAAEMASIDALDQGEAGRAGPNPDTYQGV